MRKKDVSKLYDAELYQYRHEQDEKRFGVTPDVEFKQRHRAQPERNMGITRTDAINIY